MRVLIVYITAPNLPTAREIAQRLVDERLAACCNLLPGGESVYRWGGKVETGQECLMIVKTTEERFPMLRNRVVELHPYDLPEILAHPVSAGLDPYLEWVRQSVVAEGGERTD